MGSNDFLLISSLAGKSSILDGFGIFFARYAGPILAAIFVIVLVTQKDWRRRMHLIFFSLLTVIIARGIIKTALNYILFRERPFVVYNTAPLIDHAATSPSFPSGHATLYFALAALMFFWIDRRWGIWFLIGAFLISIARVFVGVHYPLDVIAGAAIGFITPFLVATFMKKYIGSRDPDSGRDTVVPQ